MRYIGNPKCVYNALHPTVRCSVNPEGPCTGCLHFKPKTIPDRFARYVKEMRLNRFYWYVLPKGAYRGLTGYISAMAEIALLSLIVIGFLISHGTSVFPAGQIHAIARAAAGMVFLSHLGLFIYSLTRHQLAKNSSLIPVVVALEKGGYAWLALNSIKSFIR